MKYKIIVVAAAVGVLLSGCGGSAPEASPSSSSPATPTASDMPKTIPKLVGRPFPEARGMLVAANPH
ncbi:hypothetical protein [Paenarthrobacter sp. A20]|uniref:hypothetical protein n=1 Tax=Paenarthrobacter sp. A20 TaxID=2817891 RepID=UPI0020A17A54|nr:hypothetical protein [Paenarthrobacter sp. A20]